ncbi:hypothetical protein PBI_CLOVERMINNIE_58 [Gordonia phage CloverMinnie]|nr:hypothetical protein PBI_CLOVERMINNIE_58 [Gordonia phage CloverMinnie]
MTFIVPPRLAALLTAAGYDLVRYGVEPYDPRPNSPRNVRRLMQDHTARPAQQRLPARPRVERCRVGQWLIPVSITQGAGDGLELRAVLTHEGREYHLASSISHTPGKHLQNVVAHQLAAQLAEHVVAEIDKTD